MTKPVVIVKKAVRTVSKPSKSAPAAKKAVPEKEPVEVVKKSKTVLIKPELVIQAEEPVKADKAPKEGSKMAIATDLYLKMKSEQRKDVIAEFIDKAKLTSAGASTYFEILRKKHGKTYE